MAAPKEVKFSIGAIDRTRAVLRRIRGGFRSLTRFVLNFRTLVAGVFAGAAIRGLANFAEGIENIGDAAPSLDLTTDEMQALIFAAREVGVAGSQIETVFQRLKRRAGQAADGNELLQDKFLALGISMDDLNTLSTIELFDRLLAKQRELGNIGEARVADILDTEGLRVIRRLIPEFTDFADILQKARAGGAILPQEELQRWEAIARQLREFFDKAKQSFAPVLSRITEKLTPKLPAIAQGMEKLANALIAFIEKPFLFEDESRAVGSAAARVSNQFARGEGTAANRVFQHMARSLEDIRNISRRAERENKGADAGAVLGP